MTSHLASLWNRSLRQIGRLRVRLDGCCVELHYWIVSEELSLFHILLQGCAGIGWEFVPKLSHSATGHNSDPVSSSTPEGRVRKRGNFPLAECNEISGKCFSHTRWGPGYRSCDRILCVRYCWSSHPPTHPKISGNFVILLVSPQCRDMLCVHFH